MTESVAQLAFSLRSYHDELHYENRTSVVAGEGTMEGLADFFLVS